MAERQTQHFGQTADKLKHALDTMVNWGFPEDEARAFAEGWDEWCLENVEHLQRLNVRKQAEIDQIEAENAALRAEGDRLAAENARLAARLCRTRTWYAGW